MKKTDELYFSTLEQEITSIREQIVAHPLYTRIQSPVHLRHFMELHVYAVWDFMSLLKTLQNMLTCTEVPWFPRGSADTRYLINEIVTGEESDTDINGHRLSHFEMYLQAMEKAGADTLSIRTFCETLKKTRDLSSAFQEAGTPAEARAFVQFTFDLISRGKPHVLAAVFTFGREDLIPDMFLSFIKGLQRDMGESIAPFVYYMERHIEVDGGHHSYLAREMTQMLCEEHEADAQEISEVVKQALKQRISLWDGVVQKIEAPENILQ